MWWRSGSRRFLHGTILDFREDLRDVSAAEAMHVDLSGRWRLVLPGYELYHTGSNPQESRCPPSGIRAAHWHNGRVFREVKVMVSLLETVVTFFSIVQRPYHRGGTIVCSGS